MQARGINKIMSRGWGVDCGLMGPRILVVVEDDAETRTLVRFLLETEAGLEVVGEAATAEEALRLANDTKPDLAILDHYIEGDIMGLELSKHMRQALPDIKIILFSSHDLHIEAAREPAVDRFVPKSQMHELPAVIKQLLGV